MPAPQQDPQQDPQGEAQKAFVDELGQLFTKSIEANARVMQDGSEFLKQLAASNIDLEQIAARGGQILSRALTDYARLNADHTSKLIDLGLEFSRDLLASAGVESKTPTTTTPAPTEEPPYDIKVVGKPGELCQTAFLLKSDRTEPVDVRFVHSGFVDIYSGQMLDLPVVFEPLSFTLHPKENVRVIIGLPLPEAARPGHYHMVIRLDGYPEMSFRLLLEVSSETTKEASAVVEEVPPTPTKKTTTTPKKRPSLTVKKKSTAKKSTGAKSTQAKKK